MRGRRWKTKRTPVPHKRARWNAKPAVCLGSKSSGVELESGVESRAVRVESTSSSSFGVRERFESGAGLLAVGAQRSLESGRGSSPVQGCCYGCVVVKNTPVGGGSRREVASRPRDSPSNAEERAGS